MPERWYGAGAEPEQEAMRAVQEKYRPADEDLQLLQRQFAIATADGSSEERLATLSALLHKVREQLRMDVVFVSEFADGRRVFRCVDRAPGEPPLVREGGADPLEQSYCIRIVDGRLPQMMRDARTHPEAARLPVTQAADVGAHLSVPIVLRDGTVFGTLCCFSHKALNWLADRDVHTMRAIAQLIARRIDAGKGPGAGA